MKTPRAPRERRNTGAQRMRLGSIPSPQGPRGFTLVELVAVLVILGAIVAVALPIYRSFKYDARVAAMRKIEVAIAANQVAAMQAYQVRGSAGDMDCQGWPTDSVIVQGKQISVWKPEDAEHYSLPAGTPSACGMFVMLGCGTADEVTDHGYYTCAAFPGHVARVNWRQFQIGPRSSSDGTRIANDCFAEYQGSAGFTEPLWSDQGYGADEWGSRTSIEYYWYAWAGYDRNGYQPVPGETCSD